MQGAAPGTPTPPSPKLTVVALTSLTGGQWKAVGPSGFAGQGSVYNALAFEPGTKAHTAVVAFQCDAVARRLCVRSWVNNAWQPLGTQVRSHGATLDGCGCGQAWEPMLVSAHSVRAMQPLCARHALVPD